MFCLFVVFHAAHVCSYVVACMDKVYLHFTSDALRIQFCSHAKPLAAFLPLRPSCDIDVDFVFDTRQESRTPVSATTGALTLRGRLQREHRLPRLFVDGRRFVSAGRNVATGQAQRHIVRNTGHLQLPGIGGRNPHPPAIGAQRPTLCRRSGHGIRPSVRRLAGCQRFPGARRKGCCAHVESLFVVFSRSVGLHSQLDRKGRKAAPLEPPSCIVVEFVEVGVAVVFECTLVRERICDLESDDCQNHVHFLSL